MSKKHKYRMDAAEVRKLSDEEIGIELDAQRAKFFNVRSLMVTEKVEDFSQFGAHKRNIARLLTEQSARRHKTSTAPRASKTAKSAKKKAAKKTSQPATKPAGKGAKKASKSATSSTARSAAKTAKKSGGKAKAAVAK